MTNAKQRNWFETEVPDVVLHTAQRTMRKGAFRRKARLGACALVRRFIEEVHTNPEALRCVCVAEDVADGLCNANVRNTVREEIVPPWPRGFGEPRRTPTLAEQVASLLLGSNGELASSCQQIAHAAVEAEIRREVGEWQEDWDHRRKRREVLERARAEVCDLYRDVFPPPFAAVPDVREFVSEDVARWARGIYDERSFDELPVLADALEERGCDDVAALSHLRGDGSHYRGCWALDAVLGLPSVQ